MKTCRRCLASKSVDSFSWRNKAKGTKNSWCKQCMKSYDRENNKRPERAAQKKVNVSNSIQRARDYVFEYMQSHPCVDCGEADFVVLQFDHIDRNSKESNVAEMVSSGYGVDRIKLEVAKCEVRCANCHMRKTASQLGWWSATQ